ncbi:MAG: 4Fe-4S dicluster domain-containing protein [Sedimentisphaerales bacterium]|nr:4Fe-4S dicluster domain-containing protein [Sedimentisphaerales bacterium]
MEKVFTSKLESFLNAVAEKFQLYVPAKTDDHYTYNVYDPSGKKPVELNDIRTCTPIKEFLFPIRELAATYPKEFKPDDIKPFAVFGLKECDLRSIEILDKVFAEEDFEDQLYLNRRNNMFIISSDCNEPGESCFCNIFGGKGFAESGFDLNVSKIKDGFIIEAGSSKGNSFLMEHSDIFGEIPDALLSERDANRAAVQARLEEKNDHLKFDVTIKQIVEDGCDSDVFDREAKNCVECQACTRVCPTCHCFYLYDMQKEDYFAKMKMWDSCMRLSYATVAGGENPNKVLGDRMKHRLLHKFVHFHDRYGLDMCVGCGRCVDADAGGMDIRDILKKLKD